MPTRGSKRTTAADADRRGRFALCSILTRRHQGRCHVKTTSFGVSGAAAVGVLPSTRSRISLAAVMSACDALTTIARETACSSRPEGTGRDRTAGAARAGSRGGSGGLPCPLRWCHRSVSCLLLLVVGIGSMEGSGRKGCEGRSLQTAAGEYCLALRGAASNSRDSRRPFASGPHRRCNCQGRDCTCRREDRAACGSCDRDRRRGSSPVRSGK